MPFTRPTLTADGVDVDRPYPVHQLVDEKVCTEILGLSITQQKRARFGGMLPFYRHYGRTIRYRVGDLYDYRESMKVNIPPKPITRVRTPEHNAKIAASMKALRAKRNDDEIVWE